MTELETCPTISYSFPCSGVGTQFPTLRVDGPPTDAELFPISRLGEKTTIRKTFAFSAFTHLGELFLLAKRVVFAVFWGFRNLAMLFSRKLRGFFARIVPLRAAPCRTGFQVGRKKPSLLTDLETCLDTSCDRLETCPTFALETCPTFAAERLSFLVNTFQFFHDFFAQVHCCTGSSRGNGFFVVIRGYERSRGSAFGTLISANLR